MPPDWDEQERVALEVLAAGRVEGPPQPPWRRDGVYPLALDINEADGIAAVSFAILDMHPRIAPGWWCEAITFSLRDGRWRSAGGETDNTTSPDPFTRPTKATNSVNGWSDWHSNSGPGEWAAGDLPRWRHTFFGVAPAGTARLTVTDETRRVRDLQITPWNGAYVAIVAGVHSTLTGYDNRGNRLGSFEPADGYPEDWPEIEPPPGWERVPGGPIVFIERTPPTDSG